MGFVDGINAAQLSETALTLEVKDAEFIPRGICSPYNIFRPVPRAPTAQQGRIPREAHLHLRSQHSGEVVPSASWGKVMLLEC